MRTRLNPLGTLASSGVYFACDVSLMLAGIVSMPFMTRLLSRDEYGLVNMVFASIAICGVFGQLGFSQATTRFYAERDKQGPGSLHEFCGNMLGGTLISSVVVALLAVLGATSIARGQWSYAKCLQLGSLIIVTRAVANVVYQIYRAQERVLAYAVGQIIARYGTLALTIMLLLLYRSSAYEVILATVIGEAVVVIGCITELAGRDVIRRPKFSWPTLKTATAYGMPLALAGSASFILDYGDRFLIERFMGLDAVAMYAVPYDLADKLTAGPFSSVRLAAIPIIFRLWAYQGEEATSQFASRIFSYLIAIALPLGTLVVIMQREIVVFLASAKYSDSASLIPYLLPGVLMGQLNFIIALGLTIQKKTMVLAFITLLSGLTNIGLNLVLLPKWGLMGAAVATTVAYTVLLVSTYVKSRRALPLHIDYPVVGKAVLATGLMAALLIGVGPVTSELFTDLAMRGMLGVGVALGCMLVLDREIRVRAWGWVR